MRRSCSRLVACVLLVVLPLQALAAVAGAACMMSGDCPEMQMEMAMPMHDMPESGCHQAEAAAAPTDALSHLPCGMDQCPLMASPAVLTQASAVFAQAGCSPQQTLASSDFQSADPLGLLRPPRRST